MCCDEARQCVVVPEARRAAEAEAASILEQVVTQDVQRLFAAVSGACCAWVEEWYRTVEAHPVAVIPIGDVGAKGGGWSQSFAPTTPREARNDLVRRSPGVGRSVPYRGLLL